MDGISDVLDALRSLPGDLHPHLAKGKRPPHGSVSSKELAEAKSSPELSSLIVGATKLAAAKLDATKDQIKALSLLQGDLSLKFAPAGPARSVLEASSAVIWLLGGDGGAQDRAQRYVRLKRGELKEERKLANVQGGIEPEDPETRETMREAIRSNNEEIKEFEELVLRLGLESLDPISQTDLIRETLDMEFQYRLYSNLTHSAGFVILHMQHIFAESDKDNAAKAWLHTLHPPTRAYARAAWYFAAYHGVASPQLRCTLAESFDKIGLKDGVIDLVIDEGNVDLRRWP